MPDPVARINRLRAIALLPVLVASIWNTGQQYALSLNALSFDLELQWQDKLAIAAGFNPESTSLINSLIAGIVLVGSVTAISVFAAGIIERLAANASQRPFDRNVVYVAFLYAFLMPPAASVFHIVFGITFGLFLGSILFGGEGKSFLHPALVGVALTQASFPGALTGHPVWTDINGYAGTRLFNLYQTEGSGSLVWLDAGWWNAFTGAVQGFLGSPSALAALIGAIVLLSGRVISWRLLGGQILGVIVVASLCNIDGNGVMAMPWYDHLVLGSFAFGAVFLAADPSSSACTNTGRWVQGFLIGSLVVWLRAAHPAHPDSVIPVMLLMSMLAPLIDHGCIRYNVRKRMKTGQTTPIRVSEDG